MRKHHIYFPKNPEGQRPLPETEVLTSLLAVAFCEATGLEANYASEANPSPFEKFCDRVFRPLGINGVRDWVRRHVARKQEQEALAQLDWEVAARVVWLADTFKPKVSRAKAFRRALAVATGAKNSA